MSPSVRSLSCLSTRLTKRPAESSNHPSFLPPTRVQLDWPLRAQLYEWQCAHLDRDATMRPFDGAGIVAFANERAGLVPPAVAEALALELAHRRTRRRIRAVLAAGAASNGSDIAASNDSGGGPLPREEHVRAIVMAHAAATRLEHFVPGMNRLCFFVHQCLFSHRVVLCFQSLT